MFNNDWGSGWQDTTRKRLLILAAFFCGLYFNLEVRLFELAGLHKAPKVPPSLEIVMLIALIFISPVVALVLTRLLQSLTNRTVAAITGQDHHQELAIAILMLRERIKRNLFGKSLLVTVSFSSAILWLIGAANQGAMLVCLFTALCLVASIADDVLLANRIINGTFAESEADARDLLLFICETDNSNFDDFSGRPMIPNDPVANLGKRITGAPGLPNL